MFQLISVNFRANQNNSSFTQIFIFLLKKFYIEFKIIKKYIVRLSSLTFKCYFYTANQKEFCINPISKQDLGQLFPNPTSM